MDWRSLALGILCCLGSCALSAQSDAGRTRKDASELLASGYYSQALRLMETWQSNNPNDLTLLPLLAQAQWENHQAEKAAQSWSRWLKSGEKADPETLRKLAIAQHHAGQFKEAIRNYKKYLAAETKAEDREYIIACIKRAGNGQAARFSTQQVLIENPGDGINGPGADFKPVPSQTVQGRFYFSSIRPGNLGGKQNAKGEADAEKGSFSSDIFVTRYEKGVWSPASALEAPVNSTGFDVLQDFKHNGNVLYLAAGPNPAQMRILTDTFKARGLPKSGLSPFDSPVVPELGDRDPVWVNDSTLIFASRRLPGLGGYDLYISVQNGPSWTPPVNLGAPVNTPFDEIAPYLTRNGLNLYFSSNSEASIGGFDVFRCAYSRETGMWSPAENLGLPVNSAGDDLWFRLSLEGQEAYLSSDRRDQGFGGSDVYIAYFKKPADYQSLPNLSFAWVNPLVHPPLAQTNAEGVEIPRKPAERPKIGYPIEPLYLNKGDFVLTEALRTRLNELVAIYRNHPGVQLQVRSQVAEDVPGELDLFFAVRNGEKAAEYLVQAGVPAEAISIASFGANYPLAMPEIAGVPNPSSAYFNNRLDFRVFAPDTSSTVFSYPLPEIGESLKEPRGYQFQESQKGLLFRVQFLVSRQMYKGEIFNNGLFKDPYLETQAGSGSYRFMIGQEKRYQAALGWITRLRSQGFDDAYVVAYLDGKRLNSADVTPDMMRQYPELRAWNGQ